MWNWCGSEYVYQQITWNLYISPLLMLLSTVPPKMYIASEITAAAWKSLPLGSWGKKTGSKQKEKDKKGTVIKAYSSAKKKDLLLTDQQWKRKITESQNIWVERNTRGLSSPTLKRLARMGIEPATLALRAPCSDQTDAAWGHTHTHTPASWDWHLLYPRIVS